MIRLATGLFFPCPKPGASVSAFKRQLASDVFYCEKRNKKTFVKVKPVVLFCLVLNWSSTTRRRAKEAARDVSLTMADTACYCCLRPTV